jgi:hypothetical protein
MWNTLVIFADFIYRYYSPITKTKISRRHKVQEIKKHILTIGLNNKGTAHLSTLFVAALIIIFGVVGTFRTVNNHVSGDIQDIRSGLHDYCLDDSDSLLKSGNKVDIYKCNDTTAQAWSIDASSIKHEDNYCLSINNDSKTAGADVVLNNCNNSPGQVWLANSYGYFNPNAQLCLSASNTSDNAALVLGACNSSSASDQWSQNNANTACSGNQGQVVACYAEKEYATWQAGKISHETLLNQYTGNASYEEWCADFVSYVYKEAGYPFTGGEYNGWDESNANNIQYMGFTMHSPSNYTPKPGDIAYFNYTGGHVEIVVSGGKTPSFIYGNSAIIDPSTGNGEMESNTITNDGSLGQLVYYLSPN